MDIIISTEDEKQLREFLKTRTDFESKRIQRYLDMPDLSRTEGSPLKELITRITALPSFQDFDIIHVPEIVPTDVTFDFFNFAPDHPARSHSDTYYIDDTNVLRTHTTIMWYYYFKHEEIQKKIAEELPLGVLCYGKVYRKDEIDRHHMNTFHQVDAMYLHPTKDKELSLEDLKNVLADVAKAMYGADIEYRFNGDTFPYTDPSLEMEIKKGDQWIEILGGGMVRPVVMEMLGVDPKKYTGWAFGSGLERQAIISMDLPDIRLLWSDDERVKKQMVLGNKFIEVSKYPPVIRDISFIVEKSFVPNNYFDLIRHIGGDLVEQVELLDKYENDEKFGPDKMSYTYRITYRSNDRTLTAEEIDPIQEQVYNQTAEQFKADLR